MSRIQTLLLSLIGLSGLALALACGGGASSLNPPPPSGGTVGFLTTDATSETWSEVGIIIRKASLVLASDTQAASPVQIYSAPSDANPVNLLQADQIDDLLGQVSGVPAGTYDRLILEVDGKPANITLIPAPDPTTGLPAAAIDASFIVVKGASDPANPTWKVLPTITLAQPLTVAAGQTSAVAVDFDVAHPAFIVEHDTGADTLYVVNFGTKSCFRHKAAASLDRYYLRRHLGTVASVAADGSSLTVTTDHGQTLTFKTDAGTSPTLFYNLDLTPPVTPLASSVVPATLAPGLGVEATARYQADGSLTAVRVWYSATTSNLPAWTPEGHIFKIDQANKIIYVLNAKGLPVPYTVNGSTRFYLHGDLTTDLAGGAGDAFLPQLERYFKVHLTVVDPNPATGPVVAATVDIQRALFEGSIAQTPAPSANGFTYQKLFGDGETATHTLGYAPSFSFWDFTFPGAALTDIPTFLSEAESSIALNVDNRQFMPYGASSLDWAPATSSWNAVNTVFMPVPISLLAQDVTTPLGAGATTLGVTSRAAGALEVTVDLDPAAQEQPLVTQFTRSGGATVTVTTLSPDQWSAALALGAKVRVYGVPDRTGNLKAYYVNIYN